MLPNESPIAKDSSLWTNEDDILSVRINYNYYYMATYDFAMTLFLQQASQLVKFWIWQGLKCSIFMQRDAKLFQCQLS